MKVVFKEEARQDLNGIDAEIREEILAEIEGLEENATPNNSTFIEIGDLKLFRLKLQRADRNSALNHRVFYQIDGRKVYIRGIFHRSIGYGDQI
jgi:mRNA-degrading endonuclease RelE of RelBE toxin-antitoxin system